MLNNNEIYGSNLDPGHFVVTQIFEIKKQHGSVKRPRTRFNGSIYSTVLIVRIRRYQCALAGFVFPGSRRNMKILKNQGII